MSEQKATKATFFCAHNSKRIKVAYLRLVLFVLFVRVESFCKKKVNRLKIVLITSFPYTTSVYPPQPFIDNHFYAFIFICDYLWEFFFMKKLFKALNLFLWESFYFFISKSFFLLLNPFFFMRALLNSFYP